MIVTFICGCKSGEIVDRENLKTMDTVIFDDEGFLTCSVHRLRRVGWLSLPIIDNEKGRSSDYTVAKYTPWEIESLIVFGEKPWRPDPVFHDTTEDKRNNDDPEKIGKEILDKRGSAKFPLVTGRFIPAEVRSTNWCNYRFSHGPHSEIRHGVTFVCPGLAFDRT